MYDAEFDGEYVYLYHQCENVEVFGAYTSDRHDETFYDEGARCEGGHTVVYHLAEISLDGYRFIQQGRYDDLPVEITEEAVESLIDEASHYGFDNPVRVEVPVVFEHTLGTDEFIVLFERDE